MNKDNEIRLFVRFLKENGVCKKFCKEFNSKEGKEFRYREFKFFNSDYAQYDFSNVCLMEYLKIVPSGNFIIYAFNWCATEWVEWDRIWNKHLQSHRIECKKKLNNKI